MSAQLVPINAGFAPAVPLVRPVILIGRHPECDVRIDSPQVSRRHCCVAMAYDRVLIRDLGSRHGVRINGTIVDEARLNVGDEIAIGHLIYRLEILAPPTGSSKSARPIPAPAQAPPLSNDPDPIIDLDDGLIPID